MGKAKGMNSTMAQEALTKQRVSTALQKALWNTFRRPSSITQVLTSIESEGQKR